MTLEPAGATVETDRLVLAPHTLDNVARVNSWDRDPELLRLNDECEAPASPEATRAFIERAIRGERADIVHFAIHEKPAGARPAGVRAAGTLIGYCMLAHIEPAHRRCRLGLTIGERAAWGRGYGGEVVRGLLGHAFGALGMNRVGAEVYAFNARALRLMDACGFAREGVLREHVWKGGVAVDEVVFGMLRAEWAAR